MKSNNYPKVAYKHVFECFYHIPCVGSNWLNHLSLWNKGSEKGEGACYIDNTVDVGTVWEKNVSTSIKLNLT